MDMVRLQPHPRFSPEAGASLERFDGRVRLKPHPNRHSDSSSSSGSAVLRGRCISSEPSGHVPRSPGPARHGRKRHLAREIGDRHAGGVDPRRLLARLAHGDLANVSFADLRRLVEAFGFELKRTSGSHHIFVRLDVRVLLNLQDVRGEAKPYEIRQFLRLVERYALSVEDER